MTKKTIDVVLLLITIFFGWLGIDKLYKGSLKFCIIKLLLNFCIIGEIWNIFDIICICVGKYVINPMDIGAR